MPNGRSQIVDQFTALPITRQRRWQLRNRAAGRCVECGAPAVGGAHCLKHLIKMRERQRRLGGYKRRARGSKSYRLANQRLANHRAAGKWARKKTEKGLA